MHSFFPAFCRPVSFIQYFFLYYLSLFENARQHLISKQKLELKVVLFQITQLYVISSNIKKINSLFIGTNTCFKKYLEKSKRLFVRKTYTTSFKLAAAGSGGLCFLASLSSYLPAAGRLIPPLVTN